MAILLDGVTADQDGAFTQIPPGDRFCTVASSNFGGGTVALEVQDSNGNIVALQEDGDTVQRRGGRSTVRIPVVPVPDINIRLRFPPTIEDPNEVKPQCYWATAYARNSNNIPLIFDSTWLYARFLEDGSPPQKSADSGMLFSSHSSAVCMDRHSGGINMVFMDFSVRKVGLKELWTLKWHGQCNTAGRWTRAGGVNPSDWPKWMRKFKDY